MQKGIRLLRKKGHEWGKAGFSSANSENHWELKGWCVHLWLTSCQKWSCEGCSLQKDCHSHFSSSWVILGLDDKKCIIAHAIIYLFIC